MKNYSKYSSVKSESARPWIKLSDLLKINFGVVCQFLCIVKYLHLVSDTTSEGSFSAHFWIKYPPYYINIYRRRTSKKINLDLWAKVKMEKKRYGNEVKTEF